MSIAALAWERFERAGHRLHFSADSVARRAQVEVHDLDGNPLFAASPGEALAIAGGSELRRAHSLLDRPSAADIQTLRNLS